MADRQSATSGKEFLRPLRERGLSGVESVASDDHEGLKKAVAALLPETAWQRFCKTVLTDRGALRIGVPRDRDGSFESILIPKHERCFRGFDERIITMHVHGGCLRTRRWRTGSHFVRSSSVKSSKPRMPREKIWRFEQI